jgi:hypothetical protein
MSTDTLMNIDLSFINNPVLRGNKFIEKDFLSQSDIHANIKHDETLKSVLEKMKMKKKSGQVVSLPTQLLPYYNKLLGSKAFDNGFQFVHVGAHHHLYSWEGYAEYEYKKEINHYDEYNAFAYLFIKKYIDKMTWVYPSHYTEADVDSHFKYMEHIKKNGYYFININQGLRFVVQPVKFTNYMEAKYNIKYLTFVANHLTSTYSSDDLRAANQMLF